MPSKQKIKANRQNAARSTGPRTAHGKARASINAYKHGLAKTVLADPALAEEVERLERALKKSGAGIYDESECRSLAECQLDLLRIRKIRAEAIQAGLGASASLLRELHHSHHMDNDGPMSLAREFLAAIMRVLPQVHGLERYERRAFSRRRRVIREARRRHM
jgi:hypothetical protein